MARPSADEFGDSLAQTVAPAASPAPAAPVQTNLQRVLQEQADRDTALKAAAAADPLLNKAAKPTAPAGYEYQWIGATLGGSWQLYKLPVNASTGGGAPAGPSGTTTTTGSTGPTGPTAAEVAQRQNIFDQVSALFKSYGVIKDNDPASDALLKTIKDLATSGAGSDTISLALQQSDAYKARFAGNTTRLAAGLNVLSPAEYIATENAYDQILRAAGVPAQFYQGTDEKAKLIGADVSATELSKRVDLAQKAIANADPFYAEQLKNYYGLSTGDMVAHVLDPKAAMPLLEKQTSAAEIGAAAARQGLGISARTAENLFGSNISTAQAEQGFRAVAQNLTPMQNLAQIYGGDAGAQGQNLVASTFGTAGAAYAEQQIKALTQKEIGSFSGSAGVDKNSLGANAAGAGGAL